MTDFTVVSDPDFACDPQFGAKQEMADFAGRTLASAYPGYRWRVEPHPHPTRPFLDIRVEETASVALLDAPGGAKRVKYAPVGYTVKLWKHYSASSLKAEILKGGGSVLELFELSRRACDLAQVADRRKAGCAGMIVLPSYF